MFDLPRNLETEFTKIFEWFHDKLIALLINIVRLIALNFIWCWQQINVRSSLKTAKLLGTAVDNNLSYGSHLNATSACK